VRCIVGIRLIDWVLYYSDRERVFAFHERGSDTLLMLHKMNRYMDIFVVFPIQVIFTPTVMSDFGFGTRGT